MRTRRDAAIASAWVGKIDYETRSFIPTSVVLRRVGAQ